MTGDAPILDPVLDPDPERSEDSQSPRNSRWFVRLSELSWRLIGVVAAIALIAYVLWQIRLVVLPLLIAVLLTALLQPVAQWLRSRGVPNLLATAAVFLGGVGVLAGAISLVVPAVVDELSDLVASVRAGIGELGDLLVEAPLGLSQVEAQETIREAERRLTDSLDSIASSVLSGALLVGEVLAGVVIVLVLVFFFLKDGPLIWGWVTRLFGERGQETVERVGEASWIALGQYVRGIVFVATFDAVFIALALVLIGVPLVIPLAVLTFIAAFVPYAGAVIAGAVAALVALVSNGVAAALFVVLAVLIVQATEGNVLYPLIVGRSMHLHPVGILLAVTTGAVVGGIIGAVVAVPILAVINAAVPIIRSDAQGRDSPPEPEAAQSEPPPPE